jgi:hypothetical protein
MTGFRTDSISAAALAAAVLIWPVVAAGQASGPPMPIGGDQPATVSVPSAVRQDPEANAGAQQPGIRITSLGAVDGPPLGTLDSTNGGLGNDIWLDTPKTRVEDMLKRLPLATPDSSVHALARRLVLTTADEPLGDAPHAFLSVRLRALLNAGMLEDAAGLATKAAPKDDPELARLVADALLYAGHESEACGPATNLRLESGERFWVALRAFCYAAAGDAAALDLTRAVMKAQKLDDRSFETLLDDFVSHRAIAPGRIAGPSSLDVYLLQTAGLPVDPSWSQQLGTPINVIAMRDVKDAPDARLEAAGNAARVGAASPQELSSVVDLQTFSPDQLSGADAVAPTLPFLAGQALLRQAVRNETDPSIKKKLLLEALALAYGKNLVPLAAMLQGSAVSAIIPDRADRAHAALVASALMLSGHAEAAARWYDVLDLNSEGDKPLIHLLQVELNLIAPNPARAFGAQGALAWFAAQASGQAQAGSEQTLSFALLALGACNALQLPEPVEANAALAQLESQQLPGREPPADLLKHIAGAGKDGGQRGGAILDMLDFVGKDGPGDMTPGAIVAFVEALAQMGYNDAAHDLAVDALLLHRSAPVVAQSASAS